jgi:hypothetical protein
MKRLAWVILFAGVLLACQKKTPSFNNSKTFAFNLQTQVNDFIRISSELDGAFNAVDSVLVGDTTIAGASVSFAVDSLDTLQFAGIGYNRIVSANKPAGAIQVTGRLGSKWDSTGDSVTVTFINYLTTRLSDNKRIRYSGNLIYRNVSGGNFTRLASGGSPLVYTITGNNFNIIYGDSSVDSLVSRWQFGRQRTYTYNGGLVISTVGLDSAGILGSVADWGSNRFGNSITVIPVTPLVRSQGCGWQLTGGQATLNNPSGISNLTFGLDSTGKATGCPISGNHFYYQLSWTGDGENPYTGVIQY